MNQVSIDSQRPTVRKGPNHNLLEFLDKQRSNIDTKLAKIFFGEEFRRAKIEIVLDQ